MPFFINLTNLVAFAAAFSCVASLIVPIIGESVNLAKDNAQYQACKAADPKTTVGLVFFLRVPLRPDPSY